MGAVALHQARFAKRHELTELLQKAPCADGVLFGTRNDFFLFKRFVSVRPTKSRREIGNTVIVGPTRSGKGLLAISQLLSWQHSVIVNDIKGELFAAAKLENQSPLPYARHLIRSGLQACAARLHAVSPELATQFLDVSYTDANFSDRFLLSSWGTLTARMRPLLTETVVRCFTRSDFTAEQIMQSERPITIYLRWK